MTISEGNCSGPAVVVVVVAVVVVAVVVSGVVVAGVVECGAVVVVGAAVLLGACVLDGAGELVDGGGGAGCGSALRSEASGLGLSELGASWGAVVVAETDVVAGVVWLASLVISRTMPHTSRVISKAVSTPQPMSAGARRYHGDGGSVG